MSGFDFECTIARSQITRYVGGEQLAEDMLSQLEAHIVTCSECQSFLQEKRELALSGLSEDTLGSPVKVSQVTSKTKTPTPTAYTSAAIQWPVVEELSEDGDFAMVGAKKKSIEASASSVTSSNPDIARILNQLIQDDADHVSPSQSPTPPTSSGDSTIPAITLPASKSKFSFPKISFPKLSLSKKGKSTPPVNAPAPEGTFSLEEGGVAVQSSSAAPTLKLEESASLTKSATEPKATSWLLRPIAYGLALSACVGGMAMFAKNPTGILGPKAEASNLLNRPTKAGDSSSTESKDTSKADSEIPKPSAPDLHSGAPADNHEVTDAGKHSAEIATPIKENLHSTEWKKIRSGEPAPDSAKPTSHTDRTTSSEEHRPTVARKETHGSNHETENVAATSPTSRTESVAKQDEHKVAVAKVAEHKVAEPEIVKSAAPKLTIVKAAPTPKRVVRKASKRKASSKRTKARKAPRTRTTGSVRIYDQSGKPI